VSVWRSPEEAPVFSPRPETRVSRNCPQMAHLENSLSPYSESLKTTASSKLAMWGSASHDAWNPSQTQAAGLREELEISDPLPVHSI
jgi:hypothetical protein